MSRLIDADALLRKLKEHYNKADGKKIYHPSMELAMHDVESAPTIDAVSVVRCGECKYCVFHCGEHFCIKLIAFPVVETDDFCSYGERREVDGE